MLRLQLWILLRWLSGEGYLLYNHGDQGWIPKLTEETRCLIGACNPSSEGFMLSVLCCVHRYTYFHIVTTGRHIFAQTSQVYTCSHRHHRYTYVHIDFCTHKVKSTNCISSSCCIALHWQNCQTEWTMLFHFSCRLDSFNDLCSSRVIFYLLLLSVVIIIISIFNVEFYTGRFLNFNLFKSLNIKGMAYACSPSAKEVWRRSLQVWGQLQPWGELDSCLG